MARAWKWCSLSPQRPIPISDCKQLPPQPFTRLTPLPPPAPKQSLTFQIGHGFKVCVRIVFVSLKMHGCFPVPAKRKHLSKPKPSWVCRHGGKWQTGFLPCWGAWIRLGSPKRRLQIANGVLRPTAHSQHPSHKPLPNCEGWSLNSQSLRRRQALQRAFPHLYTRVSSSTGVSTVTCSVCALLRPTSSPQGLGCPPRPWGCCFQWLLMVAGETSSEILRLCRAPQGGLWPVLWGTHKLCCCCCLVANLCLTLLQPPWTVACLPGSSVHGISQARMLEWVVISFCRKSSLPRDRTHVSCIGRWIFNHWTTWEALKAPTMCHLSF